MKNNKIQFGNRLKELRKDKGMTQLQLAALLNVSDTSIRDWENRGIQPSYEILIEIARIFDVTVGQLLGVEDY